MFLIAKAKQNISAWKSHLLRSTNQDECRLDILKQLDQTSALLVLDKAMKYLPRKFRESQSDWFAKRGILWHITVALRRGAEEQMEMMTFVHLFESCNQDSSAVLGILNDVFRELKGVMPELQSVNLRQDNAGCYHCVSTIVAAKQAAERNGSCDRKAATIKSHMAVHLNSGHDIETASQMLEAINSFRGVSDVKVKVCNPPPSTVRKPLKWEGVSFISNIQYSEECLRVWKAYNTGPGRCLPWRSLMFLIKMKYRLLSSTDDSDSEVNFLPVKLRRAKKATPAVQ